MSQVQNPMEPMAYDPLTEEDKWQLRRLVRGNEQITLREAQGGWQWVE